MNIKELNIEEYNITSKAVLVLNALLTYANHKTMQCWPSLKTLANDCKCSLSTVQRALHELLAAGLIRKKARHRENGSQTSNIYEIIVALKERAAAAVDNAVQKANNKCTYLELRAAAAVAKTQQISIKEVVKNRCFPFPFFKKNRGAIQID